MNQPILETERLLLRPFTLADAPRVSLLAGDKRIADVTANIPHPYHSGLAEKWISSHPGRWDLGELASFAITLRDSGLLIGAIALMDISSEEGELGYWVGTDYWGAGYCTEACRRLVEYALQERGLCRVHAHHLSRNPASGKVLIKSGLTHIGSGQSECGYRKQVEPTERYERIRP